MTRTSIGVVPLKLILNMLKQRSSVESVVPSHSSEYTYAHIYHNIITKNSNKQKNSNKIRNTMYKLNHAIKESFFPNPPQTEKKNPSSINGGPPAEEVCIFITESCFKIKRLFILKIK